jgi:esterase/lipase superfamily enzyme
VSGAEPADHLSGRIYEVECAAEQGKAAAGRPIWKRLAPALFRGGKPQPKVTSLRELSAEETAAAAAAGGRPVLLHVHGVATSFRDAVIDTAELAMNLEVGKLGLTPCLFTWPSDGPVTGYDGHTRKAERSEKPLADLLAILRTQTEHVDVVAHSHGNKLLLRAAGRFRTDDKVIHEALLVAPDVDHGVMQDLLPDLARIAEHSTLYFCSHDVALKLSEGKFGAPRAGSVGIDAGHLNVDCVNVDSIVRGPVAHSYHANTQLVVADMHYTLSGLSPDRRYGLTASGKPRVFVYEPLKKAA